MKNDNDFEQNKEILRYLCGIGLTIAISGISLMGFFHTLENIYNKLNEKNQTNYEYDSNEEVDENRIFEDIFDDVSTLTRKLKK